MDTEEFHQELESVLNALVGDGQYGGFLKSRDAMRDFCQEHPEKASPNWVVSGKFVWVVLMAYLSISVA